MNVNRLFWWITGILVLVVVVLSLDLPMVVNAAKYAQVSREMVESGDWINLTIAGDAYDQKPPLLFWLGALFFKVLGVSTPVWKIAVLLASLLGIFSTYQLGKLLYDHATGQLAAFFWVLSLGFLYFHNDIHTDTLLADMVIFSIWQLATFFRNKKKIHFILGMVGTGLSMLAKGPVGLVIPATAVATHLVLHKEWKEIFHLRWLAGALILFIMILPALAGLFNQFGPEGIKFYFWTNNMGRITGSYAGKNSDPFFYLHTSLYVLAPFTVFALFGVARKIAALFQNKALTTPQPEWFTLGGIIPYVLVLSVAKAKNPHYLMAVIPLFMILAASFVQTMAAKKVTPGTARSVVILNGIISSLLWCVIFLFTLWLFPEKNPLFWGGLLLIAGLLVWFWRSFTGVHRQIALLTFSLLAFMFSLNASFYPRMMVYHAPVYAVEAFNQEAAPGEEIHCYLPPSRYWEIFFYAKNPGRYYVTEKELPNLLREQGDWVFTDEKGKLQILASAPGSVVAGSYDHSSLSKITLPFLVPSTRDAKLQKRYLIHLP